MATEQELIRELLTVIVKSKPNISTTDHKWLIGMLKDLYNPKREFEHSDCSKEINVLALCLFWGIVDDIQKSYGVNLDETETKNILFKLVKDFGQQEDFAKWCIESWCIALGKKVKFNNISKYSPDFKASNPLIDRNSQTSYSEQLFRKFVSEKLIDTKLDTDLEINLFVKGKQLGFSDDWIKSVICSVEHEIFESKRQDVKNKQIEKHKLLEAKRIKDEKSNASKKLRADSFKKDQQYRISLGTKWVREGGWWTFGCDVQHSRRSPFIGPKTASLKWVFKTGNAICSSPCIGADGKVYIGSDDSKLYAINPQGNLVWSYKCGDFIKSSPVIGLDGIIYVGCSDGILYSVYPDGFTNWYFEMGSMFSKCSIVSSPVLDNNGIIYVGCSDGKLYAVDPNGKLIWTYETGEAILSSPAIGFDGTIIFGSEDKKLYCLNPDSKLLFTVNADGGIKSSPAIGSKGTIYYGSWNGKVYSIDKNDDLINWSIKTGFLFSKTSIYSSPAIGEDGTIYIGCDDKRLYAIHPDSRIEWTFKTEGIISSSPSIDGEGTIYVGSEDQYLYAIKPDGKLKWRFKTDGKITSSPAIGADGTIFFGSWDGNFYAIGP